MPRKKKTNVKNKSKKTKYRNPASKKDTRKIDLHTVVHVAELSRLNISKSEAKKYLRELNEILTAFDELKKIKADADPSFHPLDVKDVLRKDEIEKCYPNEVALQNTEHKEKGFFKGPRAV